MHHPDFREVLAEKFVPIEVRQIVGFVQNGFSSNGEMVVLSVFLYAKEHGKSLAETLEACTAEWGRNWRYQHPDIKGDPEAPGAVGIQNRLSLANIYAALGIPNPHDEGKKIPQGSMVVKTRNSTYKIGPADEHGTRTIVRVEKPLDFTRCKMVFLAKDKFMECVAFPDSEKPYDYSTTRVESIVVE